MHSSRVHAPRLKPLVLLKKGFVQWATEAFQPERPIQLCTHEELTRIYHKATEAFKARRLCANNLSRVDCKQLQQLHAGLLHQFETLASEPDASLRCLDGFVALFVEVSGLIPAFTMHAIRERLLLIQRGSATRIRRAKYSVPPKRTLLLLIMFSKVLQATDLSCTVKNSMQLVLGLLLSTCPIHTRHGAYTGMLLCLIAFNLVDTLHHFPEVFEFLNRLILSQARKGVSANHDECLTTNNSHSAQDASSHVSSDPLESFFNQYLTLIGDTSGEVTETLSHTTVLGVAMRCLQRYVCCADNAAFHDRVLLHMHTTLKTIKLVQLPSSVHSIRDALENLLHEKYTILKDSKLTRTKKRTICSPEFFPLESMQTANPVHGVIPCTPKLGKRNHERSQSESVKLRQAKRRIRKFSQNAVKQHEATKINLDDDRKSIERKAQTILNS
mmetsp:Transcript_28425/g.96728  ORF Transcript_28425/g.96728 Transcript_28425/m.96728 type:complete len:443 (+) Transcript_28425:183-1511(+)